MHKKQLPMQLTSLFFTIFLSLNLFAQKYSGEGAYLTFTGNGITVKWEDMNNNVVTKTATYVEDTYMPNVYKPLRKYKINNSSNFFCIADGLSMLGSTCYWLYYYNELGTLYWKATVCD
jgi:hypothetical protein